MQHVIYDKSEGISACSLKAINISWMYFLSSFVGFLIIGIMTNDIIRSLLTGITMHFWAHMTHIWAHTIWPCIWFHGWHHDPNYSETIWGIFIETYVNVIGSGGLSIIPFNIIFEMLTGFKIFDNYALLYFSLLYSTFHMINYHFLDIKTHHDHHEDTNCNFGPDIIDVIFETKKDKEEYEDTNHATLNNVGLLIPVILLYGTKWDPVKFIERLIKQIMKR
tara:strand:+ start:573 stop:1235 length:663 start_codon:yes stop_codon:yes gene_type:complete